MRASQAEPSKMNLKFSLRQYGIESGNIAILRSETLSPPGNQLFLPNGQIVPLPDTDFKAKPLSILKGWVSNVAFSEPGSFTALLTDMVVLRLSDQRKFHILQFTIREFKLTESDLKRGAAEIQIEPGGIFRVVVRDKTGTPLPAKMVSFSQVEVGRPITVQVKSNREGEIIMLGRPADFHVSALGEGETLTLQIDPL